MANKFSDEQLLKFKQAGFSAEEISLFQFNPSYAPTDEELNALLTANEVVETLDLLPENLDALFEQIELTYGVLLNEDLPADELKKRIEILAKQNPTLAKQVVSLAALDEYANLESEEE